MPTFNGHKNWNHWNVSLWINNDEPLYRLARELKRRYGASKGAEIMLEMLPRKTPDGAPYSKSAIIAAMRD